MPAREGALRLLRAARDAGVKRVVLTSSFAAIGYGQPPRETPFDETSWTDTAASDVPPYHKSKTLAERAAWDFIAKEGGSLELAAVNPVGVFGPVLGRDYSTSILIVQRLLDGSVPGCPKFYLGVVDVRDVADLHLRAMTHPAARGERFLAVAGDFLSMLGMANVLRARLGAAARRVPTEPGLASSDSARFANCHRSLTRRRIRRRLSSISADRWLSSRRSRSSVSRPRGSDRWPRRRVGRAACSPAPMPLNFPGEFVSPISLCRGQSVIWVAQKLVVLVEFPVQAGVKGAVQAEVLGREQLVDPQVARGGEFGYRKRAFLRVSPHEDDLVVFETAQAEGFVRRGDELHPRHHPAQAGHDPHLP